MRRALLAAWLLVACAPAEPASSARPAPRAPLPPGFELLGGPCPQGPPQIPGPQYACTADHVVARVYTMVQEPLEPGPPHAAIASMPPGSAWVEGAHGAPVRVFLDGDRLWVAAPCVPCRVSSEEVWILDLPRASDDDLARIQATLGLPERPALRTASAWQEVIAERRREPGLAIAP